MTYKMFIGLGEAARVCPAQALAPVQPLVRQDVISPRIDVFAQRALFRMLKAGPESNRAARQMVWAVKLKVLAGIYKEDQRAPALRAQSIGKGWWQLIPVAEKRVGQRTDAICLREPVGLPPMIVFRDKVRSDPSRLDPALHGAWEACGIALPKPPPYQPSPIPRRGPTGKPRRKEEAWEKGIQWDEKYERYYPICARLEQKNLAYCDRNARPRWSRASDNYCGQGPWPKYGAL